MFSTFSRGFFHTPTLYSYWMYPLVPLTYFCGHSLDINKIILFYLIISFLPVNNLVWFCISIRPYPWRCLDPLVVLCSKYEGIRALLLLWIFLSSSFLLHMVSWHLISSSEHNPAGFWILVTTCRVEFYKICLISYLSCLLNAIQRSTMNISFAINVINQLPQCWP